MIELGYYKIIKGDGAGSVIRISDIDDEGYGFNEASGTFYHENFIDKNFEYLGKEMPKELELGFYKIVDARSAGLSYLDGEVVKITDIKLGVGLNEYGSAIIGQSDIDNGYIVYLGKEISTEISKGDKVYLNAENSDLVYGHECIDKPLEVVAVIDNLAVCEFNHVNYCFNLRLLSKTPNEKQKFISDCAALCHVDQDDLAEIYDKVVKPLVDKYC